MPVYAYKGMTTAGRATRGFVDADSARAARAKLRRDGVYPTEISEGDHAAAAAAAAPTAERRRFAISLPALRRISGMDLALATRQLSTLVGAGIPLVESLGALSQQVENARLKSVLGRVRDRVNEGSSLAEALGQSGLFSELFVSMVRAGETGGALEQVLARLSDYLEGQVRLRNKVGSILIYPAVMFVFAMVVILLLVTVVLPQITQLLASLNQELPFYTRLIIGMSNFVRAWWWAIAILAIASGVSLRAVLQTAAGRERWDRAKLELPVFGRVVRMLAISRFTRTLSTLLAGGIPIVKSLDISKHVTNNVVISQAIDTAVESITGGASLAKPLRASGHFPPLVTHMVEVGEQSGELEAMLGKVADTYDEQVETSMTRLTALLEPMLILVMVGIVLVIIFATLVPLLQVTSSLK
jgi:general secretion pathway protein F